MASVPRLPRDRRWVARVMVLAVLASMPIIPGATVAAEDPTDMVLDWNLNAINAIGNAPTAATPGLGQPPPLAPIHLAMVHGAIYDAVNAIDGAHEAYLDGLPAVSATASKAAAVATAARDVLLALATASPAVTASVEALYVASLAEIDASADKDAGIAIGHAAAAAMLLDRMGDGRFGSLAFTAGTEPGEWRLVPPLSNNVFAWISQVRPFTLNSPDQLRTEGPPALTSAQYAAEFNEVKALGAQTGSSRTEAQSSLAAFVSSNPFPMMNRAMREIAAAQGLSTTEQALLFVRTSMSTADSLIACWNNKVHWSNWRPYTAIREAANDGNPDTAPDPNWVSLIPAPGYPDNPSGYNCLTAGMFQAARFYFGTDRMSFSLTSSGVPVGPGVPVALPGSTRTYTRFTDIIRDAIDGRMLNGLHFRSADVQAAWIGKKAAQWLDKHYFEAVD
ncbi:MAG TPA: vanadium-dependent haloperoxidase [Candidatus Limnocylindrales bacterium]|nr:vanadium-dependent haloperoxidase [Candidatus Limnocylindrales bacterium]